MNKTEIRKASILPGLTGTNLSWLVAFLFACAPSLAGQGGFGELRGTVIRASAILPNATMAGINQPIVRVYTATTATENPSTS